MRTKNLITGILIFVISGCLSGGITAFLYEDRLENQQEIYLELWNDYNDLSDEYSDLVDEYDNLVGDYNNLSNEYNYLLTDYNELDDKYNSLFAWHQSNLTYLSILENPLENPVIPTINEVASWLILY